MIAAQRRRPSIIATGALAAELRGVQRLYDLVTGIVPEAVYLTNPTDGEDS